MFTFRISLVHPTAPAVSSVFPVVPLLVSSANIPLTYPQFPTSGDDGWSHSSTVIALRLIDQYVLFFHIARQALHAHHSTQPNTPHTNVRVGLRKRWK